MLVHANSVPHTVREMCITRSKPGVADHLASSRIHRLAGNARSGRSERSRLGFVNYVEHTLHFVTRSADHERARDIRLVAFHLATVVDHDDAAFADGLGLTRSVGKRRPCVYLATCFSRKARLSIAR